MSLFGQNTSTAVMQRRHEPPDSLDFFPTPPWATRALWTHVLPELEGAVIAEPACGAGDMARTLAEVGSVYASDIHDYGRGYPVRDFLDSPLGGVDWMVTNPPFKKAAEFALHGLEIASVGVALLVRSAFTEGVARYAMFERSPPAIFATFAERVPMVKGRVDPKISSATAYCWMVWRHDHEGPSQWLRIPPCRKDLERPSDYPAEPAPLLEATA